ncbi:MAG: ParB/RepB/Spo0J family partition protein [Eubacterium sp.]
MAKRAGLGRGLDSLIPDTGISKRTPKESSDKSVEIKEVIKEVVKEVPKEVRLKISEIEPNRDQPRKQFDESALEELAESIRQYGVIQPIIVQKRKGYYEIIAGERRWRAAKMAKVKDVPVIIKDYSPQEIMEIALIENIQREDLNPIEEALAYKRLIDDYNLIQEEVAGRVAKSRTVITNSMRLLKLPDEIQQMLINDQISSGHARALLSVDDIAVQIEVAKRIISHKLSVRETEKLVKSIGVKKERTVNVTPDKSIIYGKLEERLKTIMGTKVSICPKAKGKGKIEIEYYSQDDLERLIELFDLTQK